MTDLRRQLLEDRALRDTARSIITQQLSRLRSGTSGKWIGEAIADRYGDRMLDLAAEGRRSLAGKGKLVAGAGAAVALAAAAWLARKPLLGLLSAEADDPAEQGEAEAVMAESPEAGD